MNENDSSDLVSKTKKSGGSKTKRTRAKRATKATASKKISTSTRTSIIKKKIPSDLGCPGIYRFF